MNKLVHLTTKQAAKKLADNADILFLDVRSYAENKFVGYPTGAILLPWIDEPNWEPNAEFDQLLLAMLKHKNDPFATEMILICRSGYRSADAGNFLIKKNFSNVAHIRTGFEGDLDEHNQRGNLNGWRYDGLPWEQC